MYGFLSQDPAIMKCFHSHGDGFYIHNLMLVKQLLCKTYSILLILYWLYPIFFISVSARPSSLFCSHCLLSQSSHDSIHVVSAI